MGIVTERGLIRHIGHMCRINSYNSCCHGTLKFISQDEGSGFYISNTTGEWRVENNDIIYLPVDNISAPIRSYKVVL